jgi:hypothetical protein
MLLPLTLLAALQLAPAADSVSGSWKIALDVMGNGAEELCTLQQTGATLSGSCVGSQGEKVPTSGEVKDGKVTFQHAGDYQGQALTIVFTGTFASPTQLKGTVEVKPMGITGTFTAAPAPAKP